MCTYGREYVFKRGNDPSAGSPTERWKSGERIFWFLISFETSRPDYILSSIVLLYIYITIKPTAIESVNIIRLNYHKR